MNLDGIKYIFQIPLAWFRQVGAFVFNSYGGNLVQINRNVDGSAEFFVDPNELKQQAQEGLAEKFVTLDTAQTITETKTITAGKGIVLNDSVGNALTFLGSGTSSGFVMYLGSSSANNVMSTSAGSLTLGGGSVSELAIGDSNSFITRVRGRFRILANVPSIGFHFNNGSSLTSSISETAAGSITISCSSLTLGSTQSTVSIGRDPADQTGTTIKTVASRGWVNFHFWRPSTTNTGVVYNTNGTITYKTIGTGVNDVAAGKHTHSASDITDLPSALSPYTSTPAALSENGSAGSSNLYSRGDHSHPYPDLTDLPCMIVGHNETCLLIVQDDGSVTHSGNEMYNNCKALSDGYQSGSIEIKNRAEGASPNATNIYGGAIALGHQTPWIGFRFNNAQNSTSRIIESASGQIKIESSNHAILSVHPAATDLDTSDTTATSLQIATAGFVNSKMTAASPATTTSIAPTSDAADNTTWTAGGSDGLSVKKLYRTKYVTSGTTPVLYGYYRTETYDTFGRLYSVSAETREVIDTTNLITLS